MRWNTFSQKKMNTNEGFLFFFSSPLPRYANVIFYVQKFPISIPSEVNCFRSYISLVFLGKVRDFVFILLFKQNVCEKFNF